MPFLFWLDVSCIFVGIVIAAALTMIAVSVGLNKPQNRCFALFAFSLAISSGFSLWPRLLLYTQTGDPLLFLELSIPPFALSGPFVLMFTARYLKRMSRATEIATVAGIVLIAALAIPLFNHQMVTNPLLTPEGVLVAKMQPLGALAALIPAVYFIWALVLFWQERKRAPIPAVSLSVLFLTAGLLLGGVLQISLPVTSITNLLSLLILGYGVMAQQLFNPLRERTIALQAEIAEREKVEAALRNSEAQMRSLIATIPDLILIFGARGEFLNSFSKLKNPLRDEREDMMGKSIHDAMPPQAAGKIQRVIDRALETRQVQEYEYSMSSARGTRWFQARVVAFEEHGEPRVLWLDRDITERRTAVDLLEQSNVELSKAYSATLEGWARALELRERETAGHSRRLVALTLRLARVLGLEGEALDHIRRGSLLHDIGKMGIPDSILLKPGPLTDEEWVIMRQHPVYAYQLLVDIPYLQKAVEIPRFHHEWWDGSGYPEGLKGEEIPIAARIFAVVDVWDALTSDRPYRPAWPEADARALLRQQAGKHFDPRVVEAFLGLEQEN